MSIISVENLNVMFGSTVKAVKNVSFDVFEDETLCIIGESGSGKSTTAFSILGLLPEGADVTGSINFQGQNLVVANEQQFGNIRGNKISMIFQEPMTSLNPVMTIGRQIAEALMIHDGLGKTDAFDEARDLLELVKMTDVENRLSQYPHELSGGMRQRVMIAMALACKPDILIADEPTTALDVTIQAEVLSLLKDIRKQKGLSVVFITHDLGVVAEIADRVAVMLHGEIVEQGSVREIFNHPQHDYTKKLLGAALRADRSDKVQKQQNVDADEPLLRVKNLKKTFLKKSVVPFVKPLEINALKGVSLTVSRGETVGIVGESGCGKSTLTRCILSLLEPTSGQVIFDGVDKKTMTPKELNRVRQKLQVVFQDPYSSLNPRQKIGQVLTEPLLVHRGISYSQAVPTLKKILDEVGLPEAALERYPHEFSGGQRQRIAIARALILEPDLIIADEAVSALDVTIRAQILDLLRDIQKERNLSFIFITHDLAVLRDFCDRALVMFNGEVVEEGSVVDLLDRPQNAYTKRLRDAAPIPEVV